jgi:hypothetical protein
MNQDITIGQAFNALNESLSEYVSDGVMVSENIEIFNYAIQNDPNFRDLLMGLPKHYEIGTSIGFVTYVLGQVDRQESTPYLTILSAYAFELGDVKLANKYANDALAIHSDYSLAQLLKRMYISGWSPSSLVAMRDTLDHKVRANVIESKDMVIANA